MMAPRSVRKKTSDQSVTQDPGKAPLTELSGNSPEIPREVDALLSRRQDLRVNSGSQPQLGEETLRWPQYEEVEPSMLRQQVPESLAPPKGASLFLTF